MAVPVGPRSSVVERMIAPATALVMLALQVGSNATRDALFLSAFPITALPWFVALSALASFPAAHAAGWLLGRLGPRRVVPAVFAAGCALFAVESVLLGPRPGAAAAVLYFHATVLGAVVISTFWSLLDERFDAYSAKRHFARAAGTATLGAVIGGFGAARIAAHWSPQVLLAVLAGGAAACAAGSLLVGRGGKGGARAEPSLRVPGRAPERDHVPYLRALAAASALAALVGTLCDYVLKAHAAAQVPAGVPLVRFFGVFYAATGVGAFLIQNTLALAAHRRIGPAGMLALHPLAVGAAGVGALVAPTSWRWILPRCADTTVRHSLFRTGYELLFRPLPDATRRSAKTMIDVGWDCVGNGLGAVVVLLLTRLVPAWNLGAITVAVVAAAAVELVAARGLREGYRGTARDDLARRSVFLRSIVRSWVHRATVVVQPRGSRASDDGPAGSPTVWEAPSAAARAALRSDDPERIRAALRHAAHDPRLIDAVIPVLARKALLDQAVRALRAHGGLAVDALAGTLVAAGTPEVVRRRIPLVLQDCPSRRTMDGLLEGLSDSSFTVRERCGRALLKVTAADTALAVPREVASRHAERELDSGSADERSMAHVFDLLALAYDRHAILVARRAYEAGTAHDRGAALAFLEATLPRSLFAKLEGRVLHGASPRSAR